MRESNPQGHTRGGVSPDSHKSPAYRSLSALRVQPDAVCEVGGSTPDLSHGDLGISLGEAKQKKLYTS